MSANKKSGLGKGFDALLPRDLTSSMIFADADRVQKISTDKLVPNPDQPRTIFDEQAIEQLADSITRFGVLQPIVVTPHGETFYIVAGERRWRASQRAGLKTIPAIVRTTEELERLEIALVENVQRVDLAPLEQAMSIERLHEQFNMTYDAVAQRLAKAPSTVNNIVRLLQLPDAARTALHERLISEGHARAILALKAYPEKQIELLQSIQKHGWSVRQAERYVTSIKEGFQEKQATHRRMDSETPATKELSKRLGAPVHVRRTAKGGKLEIAFKSDEELDGIMCRLDLAGEG